MKHWKNEGVLSLSFSTIAQASWIFDYDQMMTLLECLWCFIQQKAVYLMTIPLFQICWVFAIFWILILFSPHFPISSHDFFVTFKTTSRLLLNTQISKYQLLFSCQSNVPTSSRIIFWKWYCQKLEDSSMYSFFQLQSKSISFSWFIRH